MTDGDSIKYSEVKTALKSRIKKGSIINLKHIEFQQFMDDARGVFED